MDTKARPSRKKRRSWAFPLGLLVIVLVVAGVVAIVGAGVSGVKGVVERRENAMKEEYQKFIAPVIMNDPSPFDDLSQADIGQLMRLPSGPCCAVILIRIVIRMKRGAIWLSRRRMWKNSLNTCLAQR